MNESVENLKSAFIFVLTVLVGLIGWIGKRNADKLDSLEKLTVTREELTKALSDIRTDRLNMHQENKETLLRMEGKMDDNEEKASKTRHDTFNQIHELNLKVAVMARTK